MSIMNGVVYYQRVFGMFVEHDAHRYASALTKAEALGVLDIIDYDQLRDRCARYHEELVEIIKDPKTSPFGIEADEYGLDT